ncbi:UDP-N-acetylglucosamine 2-epimerase (non-hydrolyzing) [Ravibacter arvi]|uniref:UDP-N-acetylglucosamine 2-epimerase (non-hydrolyzing) n=1 Tax=Ravibacter arvi TaxID=2051041 RepID=A0ABP8LQS9_9BACT
MKKLKILSVFGTRRCAIKMAPVVHHLAQIDTIEHRSCSTGQHQPLLDDLLPFLGIAPDYELSVVKPGQSASEIIAAILTGMKSVLQDFCPDWLLVHGDTGTCLAASLAAFYEKIKIGHVEAGLRSYTRSSPFPGEANRFMTDFLATLHFAPTNRNALNLLREGVRPKSIAVTGHTLEETLLQTLKNTPTFSEALSIEVKNAFEAARKVLLVACQFSENREQPLDSLCTALVRIAQKYPSIQVLFPLHSRPEVREILTARLRGQANIFLSPPLIYPDFVLALRKCWAVITDSGSVQEECAFLKKRALILRENFEGAGKQPAPGQVKIIGTNAEAIEFHLDLFYADNEGRRPRRLPPHPINLSPSRKIAESLLNYDSGYP